MQQLIIEQFLTSCNPKSYPVLTELLGILQRLARFNFHLYYVKGKDMILCDFLSRIKADNSDPHGLIPIAFNYIEPVAYPTYEFQAVDYNPKESWQNSIK